MPKPGGFYELERSQLKKRCPYLKWLWPQNLHSWWIESGWTRRSGGDIDPGPCKNVTECGWRACCETTNAGSINPQVSHKTVHFVKLAKGNLKSNLWTLLWSYRWCCQPDCGAQVDTGSWSRDWELKKSPGMTEVEGPVGDGPPWRLVWSQQLFAQSATYAQHNVI